MRPGDLIWRADALGRHGGPGDVRVRWLGTAGFSIEHREHVSVIEVRVITDCGDVPMRLRDYKCGAVFGVEIRVAGRTLYHVGSAELVDENIRVKQVDLALLCVAGWTSGRDYPERVAHRLAPGAILLSHWDDFLRPIDRPARPLPAMQMPRLVDRLSGVARGVKIGTLPLLGDVWA